MRWQVEFFEADGITPVRDWLDSVSEEVRGKLLARIDLLAVHGPTLDHPYTSQVESKLREIRLRFGKTRYRVLYFFDPDRVAILLHGFTKDTDSLTEADKKTGRLRMERHLLQLARRPVVSPRKSLPRKKTL